MVGLFYDTNSAEFAFITVKKLLCLLVVKIIADFAEITSELDSTFLTVLLRALNFGTFDTFYFLYSKSVYLMVLFWIKLLVVVDFVMAHSAGEEFFTDGTLDLTKSFVMFAALVMGMVVFWEFF